MILQGTDNSEEIETNIIEEELGEVVETEYGINAPKLDAPIAIRGASSSGGNYYTTYTTMTGSGGGTVTCGFKPKAVYIDALNASSIQSENSKSWTIEEDDLSLTTTAFYVDVAQLYTLGSGASSTIKCFNIVSGNYAYISSFSSTGFTISGGAGSTSIGLHITVTG